MTDNARMRWAVLGTGIVSRKFVLGLKSLGSHSVSVVASRSPTKANAFAAQFGIPNCAPTYAEAVQREDIDAVYVATPPSEHEAHAMLAFAAGKPVLIEKPFALDAPAARRIAEAAQAANLFCMEAMWTRFLPIWRDLRECLKRQDLGEIRSLQGSFMATDVVSSQASLFDPLRGGGSLMHRGVYPLSLARHLLGPIREVKAMGRLGATGVDEDCSVVLRHESGAISTLAASLCGPGPNELVLSGTHGLMRVAAPVFRPFRATVTAVRPRNSDAGGWAGRLEFVRETGLAQRANQMMPDLLRRMAGKDRTILAYYSGNGYHYEAAEVALRIVQGCRESPIMPLAESIEIMEVIDEARSQFREL